MKNTKKLSVMSPEKEDEKGPMSSAIKDLLKWEDVRATVLE
jgi:hypothetical protein